MKKLPKSSQHELDVYLDERLEEIKGHLRDNFPVRAYTEILALQKFLRENR